MDLLERASRLAAKPCRWVPYERVLDRSQSLCHLERICRDALAVDNASVFWPALALLSKCHDLRSDYLPAGDLGYLALAFSAVTERRKAVFVTTEEAAERLNVSTRHVRRLIAAGRIKARLTDSGHWEIDRESVDQTRKEMRP